MVVPIRTKVHRNRGIRSLVEKRTTNIVADSRSTVLRMTSIPLPKDSCFLRNVYPTKALRDLQSCRRRRFMNVGRQAGRQVGKQAKQASRCMSLVLILSIVSGHYAHWKVSTYLSTNLENAEYTCKHRRSATSELPGPPS